MNNYLYKKLQKLHHILIYREKKFFYGGKINIVVALVAFRGKKCPI